MHFAHMSPAVAGLAETESGVVVAKVFVGESGRGYLKGLFILVALGVVVPAVGGFNFC